MTARKMAATTHSPAALSNHRADSTPLPRVDGVRIDGDESDWADRGLRVLMFTPDSPEPPDPTRSFATARLGWDDEGLLFLVCVTDVTPSEAPIAAAAYMWDSVELFLAPDPARWENLQIVISPGHDRAHPQPRAQIFDNRPGALQSLPKEVEWAVRLLPTGYRVEARMPWRALNVHPAPGAKIGVRIIVNDEDGAGTRTRFRWPSEGTPAFIGLSLSAGDAGLMVNEVVGWVSLDIAAGVGRVNLSALPEMSGSAWEVRRGGACVGRLTLHSNGPVATGSLALPPCPAQGEFTLHHPAGQIIAIRDTLAAQAAAALRRANSHEWLTLAEKESLAFAKLSFARHIFAGRRFPKIQFADPTRVAALLGAQPDLQIRWLDAAGRDTHRPDVPGLYAARTEIRLPEVNEPLVLENLFYHLPDGAAEPLDDGETWAQLLAFGLRGADATPSHAKRVAERWWHQVRRARGWSQPLRYRLHLPAMQPPGTAFPLLVHLHGSGQDNEPVAAQILAVLAQQAGPQVIIAYPFSRGPWRGPAVGELIDQLCEQYPVDRNRIYLIGFSLGGIGTWEVALDQPDRFAAIVPIGGRMGSPADAARIATLPIWVFNGADDPTTTPAEATVMVEALRACGGQPRFTLLTGCVHGDSQFAAYRHPGLFEWLLRQRRTNRHQSRDA